MLVLLGGGGGMLLIPDDQVVAVNQVKWCVLMVKKVLTAVFQERHRTRGVV